MRPETIDQLDAYWRSFFALDPRELARDRVLVREHPEQLQTYAGAYTIEHPQGYVMFVPPQWVDRASAATRDIDPPSLFENESIASVYGDAVDIVIGATSVAYADDTDVRPVDTMNARLLTQDDAPALERLRDACPPLEWDHGGNIYVVQHPTCAVFVDGEIAAAASWDYQDATVDGYPEEIRIRHVGVVAHPARRGRGYATAVAGAITQFGVAEGAIMQWQTLFENKPSFAIGQRIGYQQRYRTISVRLRAVS